jgi:hypothetical protein
MIVPTIWNGEVDDNSIILELNMKVLFVFDSVWNFDTNLCWGLIPSVGHLEILTYKFLFGDILFSELDNGPSRDGLKL